MRKPLLSWGGAANSSSWGIPERRIHVVKTGVLFVELVEAFGGTVFGQSQAKTRSADHSSSSLSRAGE